MAEVGEKKGMFGVPLLIGAVGFGLAAALLSYVYLKSEEKALIQKYAGREGRPVTVLVAGTDLPKGAVLRQEVLSQRQVPSQFAHSDAIPANEFERYLGRVVEVEVEAGKPILKSFLDNVFPVDFSDTVPVGRRAMTIQVDDKNAIGGFMRPGNHVDLFVNIPSSFSGYSGGFITADMVDALPGALLDGIPPSLLEVARTADTSDTEVQSLLAGALPKDVILPVLQNVRVLATGRDAYREQLDALRYPQPRSERNFSTITLDVSPREAALITAALDNGDLLALLRNRNDDTQADFSTLSAQDLFSNAFGMAEAAAAQRARVSAAAGVDARGNLVDADGKTLLNREQLAAAGLSVNAEGQLVDADGKVVDPTDVIVTADGRVLDRAALAAAGLSVNASGQVVDGDGNLVAADDLVVGADGRVMTRGELAVAGLSVNERGEVVDADGRVVDTGKLVKTADGRILTSEALAAAGLSVAADGTVIQTTRTSSASGVDAEGNLLGANGETLMSREALAAAGYAVNEQGQLVDRDGNVVDAAELVVTSDGRVMSRTELAEQGLGVNAEGLLVDANGDPVGSAVDPDALVVSGNGQVLDAGQLAAAGLSVNDRGEIVDGSGKVVDPETLVTDANGKIIDAAALAAAGLSRNARGEIVDRDGNVIAAGDLVLTDSGVLSKAQLAAAGLAVDERGRVTDAAGRVLDAREVAQVAANTPIGGGSKRIDLIIGGQGKDGVAKTTTLKTLE